MSTKIVINGFGRIGRLVLRALMQYRRDTMQVVAINHPRGVQSAAYLYTYDSVHGTARDSVKTGDTWLEVGGQRIEILSSRDPSIFDLSDVDIVMECSGVYKTQEDFAMFLKAGAKKVLVSGPFKQENIGKTIVYGVNHHILGRSDTIVSNASCTTNCLAPVMQVLEENFGIKRGFMTTVHAYTSDQNLLDASHKDFRRSRAAALSIIPTSTGAAKAVSLVLPSLKDKIHGVAVRVPTPNVSMIDVKIDLSVPATVAKINAVMQSASQNSLKGILGFETQQLVSIDFTQNPHSAIFDATQTMVMDELSARVCAWYDNEWGFSVRMLDTAAAMVSA